jgi:osmotically-inducible protein OsmY
MAMTAAHDSLGSVRDRDVQRSVSEELEWTPAVDSAHVGVAVNDGLVTLSGEVSSAMERIAARNAALRVRGVSAIADDLFIRTSADDEVRDSEIAASAAHALRLNAAVPPGAVCARVHEGAVTLTGSVAWNFQRDAARRSVERLPGVRSVTERIELTDRPSSADAAGRIRAALVRNASVDAESVTVRLEGTAVTLEGTVRSSGELRQAAEAAWSSPHVTDVRNHIRVVS